MKVENSERNNPDKVINYLVQKISSKQIGLNVSDIKVARALANKLATVLGHLLQEKYPHNQIGFNPQIHSFGYRDNQGWHLIDHSIVTRIIRRAINLILTKTEDTNNEIKEEQS